MSGRNKNEITVVQKQPLGSVAENENFLKDRKRLMDAILIASTEAENKAYHDKLLDMNPQDYAELSNVKWLFNNNRLRSQQEIDDVCVAAKYYPNYNKPRPFGHSIIANYFLAILFILFLWGIGPEEFGDLRSQITKPGWIIKNIVMPAKMVDNKGKCLYDLDYYKECGAVFLWDNSFTLAPEDYFPYHKKDPIVKPDSFLWQVVMRLICLLYLPEVLVKAAGCLLLCPFKGFFIMCLGGLFTWVPAFFLSAWFAICFGCSVKLSHKVNPAIEGLIPDLIQSGVTFEDSAMENVIKPFCSDFWDDVVTMPAESKWDKLTNKFVIWILRFLSLPPIALIIYFIFFYHW